MQSVNPDSSIVQERQASIRTRRQAGTIRCQTESLAGCVSQRACVYSGARVVLNPITDALHIVHGPVGCASYTWDIRGSLSSGSELYRSSFSTDLREADIIFGGEGRLASAIETLSRKHRPALVLVYSTCIVGVIGDDVRAVCRNAEARLGIPVMPVEVPGFAGTKSDGYRAAGDVLFELIDRGEPGPPGRPFSVNYLGDFNLAGEAWIIESYLQKIGVPVECVLTGDSTRARLGRARQASLNIVQCAGSMHALAERMQDAYGIPVLNVSFLGLEDTALSLRAVAERSGSAEIRQRAEALIRAEESLFLPKILEYRQALAGKRAAIYVGGGFKAISLLKQFAELGIEVVMIGTQTGLPHEYALIDELAREDAVVLDDANPSELERFLRQQGADMLVGGVKERALAYKLGLAFIDHNHDRKHPLSGYIGAANLAREVFSTVMSPVWRVIRSPGPGTGQKGQTVLSREPGVGSAAV